MTPSTADLLREAEIGLHQERLELAAETLEAFLGDPRNNRARDIRGASDLITRLSAALRLASRPLDEEQVARVIDPSTWEWRDRDIRLLGGVSWSVKLDVEKSLRTARAIIAMGEKAGG